MSQSPAGREMNIKNPSATSAGPFPDRLFCLKIVEEISNLAQLPSKLAQVFPKLPQVFLKSAQLPSKLAQVFPKLLQVFLNLAQFSSKLAQVFPKLAQVFLKLAQVFLKLAQVFSIPQVSPVLTVISRSRQRFSPNHRLQYETGQLRAIHPPDCHEEFLAPAPHLFSRQTPRSRPGEHEIRWADSFPRPLPGSFRMIWIAPPALPGIPSPRRPSHRGHRPDDQKAEPGGREIT